MSKKSGYCSLNDFTSTNSLANYSSNNKIEKHGEINNLMQVIEFETSCLISSSETTTDSNNSQNTLNSQTNINAQNIFDSQTEIDLQHNKNNSNNNKTNTNTNKKYIDIEYKIELCPHNAYKTQHKLNKDSSYNCIYKPIFLENKNDDDDDDDDDDESRCKSRQCLSYEQLPLSLSKDGENIEHLQRILDYQDNLSEEKKNKQQALPSAEQLLNRESSISIELLQLIKAHSPLVVFSSHINLNKRRSFFGIRKSLSDIISNQDTPITNKSLIVLEKTDENDCAIRHFSILFHQLCLKRDDKQEKDDQEDEEDEYNKQTDKYFSKEEDGISKEEKKRNLQILVLQYLIQMSQGKSDSFVNEVYTQVIKQLRNNKQQVQVLDLMQYLSCLLFCYSPSDKILLCLLHVLVIEIKNSKLWADMQPVEKAIDGILPQLLRRFSDCRYKVRQYIGKYCLSKQIIQAITTQSQISLPIFLSTGSTVYIWIEYYETVQDVKQKILAELKIETSRFTEQMFVLYDIQKENENLNRMIALDNEFIFDIIHTWENNLCQKKGLQQDENFNQFLMFKALVPFQIENEDAISIMINFSQVFYEIYTIYTNYVEEEERIIKMFALLQNVIKDGDITNEMPIYFSDKQKQEIIPQIKHVHSSIKDKYSDIHSKNLFLKLTRNSIFYDATEISIKYYCNSNDKELQATSIAFKPTSFLILSPDGHSYKQYFYKDIEQISHNNGNKTLILMKNGISHCIISNKSTQIEYLINKYQDLIQKNLLNSFNPNNIDNVILE